MCGICGAFSYYGKLSCTEPMIQRALQNLNKRGPEVQQFISTPQAILGHSRLSIIDISEAANQPFEHESGHYAIVFNGEIYNYRDLRKKLASDGESFRTDSDTEVLLKWLITKGPEGIKDLHGFFAFAFYDRRAAKLLLARDRIGKKPLLYHYTSGQLLFASEMKALLQLGIPRELDFTSLQAYFQLNYIPAPWSVYENVYKLMPGHYMLLENGTQEIRQYYKIPDEPLPTYSGISYTKAKELLGEKLEKAVQKRLISDVPLGAFLSGGIDSSVVVALAARHVQKLKTFSIGFRNQPMFDETAYALSVAKMHNTDHHVFSLTTEDMLECVNNVLDYTDEPFADSSALAVYILSRETKKHVTVALSGDGADEMFGGYNKHMAHLKAINRNLTNKIAGQLHPLLEFLPQSRNTFLGNKIRQIARYGKGIKMDDADRYWRWASYTDESYPGDLLLNPLHQQRYQERKGILTNPVATEGSINNILLNDMHLVLPNDMLTKVDLMSMANSLEVRVPFLDHEVVDLVFSMPAHYRIDQSIRKKILKDTFGELLPAELHHRPKQGFEVPLLPWFRKELKETITGRWLNDEFIRDQGLFDPKVINNLKKKLFSSNPGEIHAQIWAIGVFQYWYTHFHTIK